MNITGNPWIDDDIWKIVHESRTEKICKDIRGFGKLLYMFEPNNMRSKIMLVNICNRKITKEQYKKYLRSSLDKFQLNRELKHNFKYVNKCIKSYKSSENYTDIIEKINNVKFVNPKYKINIITSYCSETINSSFTNYSSTIYYLFKTGNSFDAFQILLLKYFTK